jgi:hypothetical protein
MGIRIFDSLFVGSRWFSQVQYLPPRVFVARNAWIIHGLSGGRIPMKAPQDLHHATIRFPLNEDYATAGRTQSGGCSLSRMKSPYRRFCVLIEGSVATAKVNRRPRIALVQLIAIGTDRHQFRLNRCVQASAKIVDLFAIDANFRRCADSQPHFAATDSRDPDTDYATDDDFFADTPCENEHGASPWGKGYAS